MLLTRALARLPLRLGKRGLKKIQITDNGHGIAR